MKNFLLFIVLSIFSNAVFAEGLYEFIDRKQQEKNKVVGLLQIGRH